jgi:hypothetical protein
LLDYGKLITSVDTPVSKIIARNANFYAWKCCSTAFNFLGGKNLLPGTGKKFHLKEDGNCFLEFLSFS